MRCLRNLYTVLTDRTNDTGNAGMDRHPQSTVRSTSNHIARRDMIAFRYTGNGWRPNVLAKLDLHFPGLVIHIREGRLDVVFIKLKP